MLVANKKYIDYLYYFKVFFLSVFLLQPWLLGGIIRFEVIIILYCLLLTISQEKIIKVPYPELLFSLFFLIVSLSIPVLHTTFDYTLFNRDLKIVFLFLGSFYILNRFSIDKNMILATLRFTILTCLVFFILCTLLPQFQSLSLLLKGNTYGIEGKLEVYRLWFPTSAHTFHLGLFFISIFSIQLIFGEKMIYLIPTVICAAISARSAMVCVLALLLIYTLIKDIRYILLLLILSPLFYYAVIVIVENSTQARYALEPIVNILENNQFETGSTNRLLEMIYIPKATHILIGSGYYTGDDGKFFGHTDSGFMRPILYGGMLYQLLYIIMLVNVYKFLMNYKTIGIIIALLFMLLNIKAEVLSPSPYFGLFCLMYWYHKSLKDVES
ncbi:hypothetical protein AB4423_19125 [Vibrio chagasii]|uniref:hypothetical protein n=2 Tax=Vibrio TaxID=662 RepID=UPI00355111E5